MDFKEIHRLTGKSGKTLPQMTVKLYEELGELSECLLVENQVSGNKYKTLKEPAYAEAVDIFIMAASIFFLAGGSIEKMDEMYEASTGLRKEGEVKIPEDVFEHFLDLARTVNDINSSFTTFKAWPKDFIQAHAMLSCVILMCQAKEMFDRLDPQEDMLELIIKKRKKWAGVE